MILTDDAQGACRAKIKNVVMKRGALALSFSEYEKARMEDTTHHEQYMRKLKKLKGMVPEKLTEQFSNLTSSHDITLNIFNWTSSWRGGFRAGSDDVWYIYSNPERPKKLVYIDQQGVEADWPHTNDQNEWPHTVFDCVFPIEDLPDVLLSHALSFLRPVPLLKLARVSKRWYRILRSNDPWVSWRDHVLRYAPILVPIFKKYGKTDGPGYQIKIRKTASKTKQWKTPSGLWRIFAQYLIIHNGDDYAWAYNLEDQPKENTKFIKRVMRHTKEAPLLVEAISRLAVCNDPDAFESCHGHSIEWECRLYCCVHIKPFFGQECPFVWFYVSKGRSLLNVRYGATPKGYRFHAGIWLTNFMRVVRGHGPRIRGMTSQLTEPFDHAVKYYASSQ